MRYTKSDVIQFVKENDIKFIKLAFCDILGNLRNASIVASELDRAFEKGIYINGSYISGLNEYGGVLLFPDPSTFCIMPWRPQHGRVVRFFCEMRTLDGTVIKDMRLNLKNLTEELALSDYKIRVSADIEFYMLKTDDKGLPIDVPFDEAGYLGSAPLDKGENIRREVCLTLEEMGITPLSSHHSRGKGQYIVEIMAKSLCEAADHAVTLKSVVRSVAANNGLYANIDAMPLSGQVGNEMRINLFIEKNDVNIFSTVNKNANTIKDAEAFTSGIISKAKDIAIFTNPSKGSYERLKMEKMLGMAGLKNIIMKGNYGSTGGERLEICFADASASPYAAIYLIVKAGLEGLMTSSTFAALPENLEDSKKISLSSKFLTKNLSKQYVEMYIKSLEN